MSAKRETRDPFPSDDAPSRGGWRFELAPGHYTSRAAIIAVAAEALAAPNRARYARRGRSYRARLKADPDAVANFGFAQEQRCILAEERTFLRAVVAGEKVS